MMFVTHLDEKYIKQILLYKTEMMSGGVDNPTAGVKRDSKICWIKDKNICIKTFNFIKSINDKEWLLNLNDIEALQYGEYAKGGEYTWHQDNHNKPYNNGLVRKISFSIILNNDFTGGEFDIEIKSPLDKERIYTFDTSKYNMIIFNSYMWHRVRPVKSGIRKSIVGWVLGPA